MINLSDKCQYFQGDVIIMKGNKIQCFFDNKLALETTDDTFMRAGKIGLWTKSDAITYFDDLKLELN